MYELEDAEEGLKSLFKDIGENDEFDETDFRIHMAHIYAHLNRAWNTRNIIDALAENEGNWSKHTHFPADLEPL